MKHKAFFLGILGVLVSLQGLAEDLPDLTVVDMTVNEDCHPVVTLHNAGTGSLGSLYDYLPAAINGIGVQFINKDTSSGAGGTTLGSALDELRPPGGSSTDIYYVALIEGTVRLEVTVDSGNKVAESNEANNSLERVLECHTPRPDIAIQNIDFTDDCRARITLANIGDAPLPSNMYGYSYGGKPPSFVERFLDGTEADYKNFRLIDPGYVLQTPGGVVVWEDTAEYRAHGEVVYEWETKTFFRENNNNYANNSRSALVPNRCKPDLAVTRIEVDEDCYVFVTVHNLGPGPLPTAALTLETDLHRARPLAAFSLQHSLNNKGFGGGRIHKDEALLLEYSGGSVTLMHSIRLPQPSTGATGTQSMPIASDEPGDADDAPSQQGLPTFGAKLSATQSRSTLGAVIDSTWDVSEVNEDNNRLILHNPRCPSAVTGGSRDARTTPTDVVEQPLSTTVVQSMPVATDESDDSEKTPSAKQVTSARTPQIPNAAASHRPAKTGATKSTRRQPLRNTVINPDLKPDLKMLWVKFDGGGTTNPEKTFTLAAMLANDAKGVSPSTYLLFVRSSDKSISNHDAVVGKTSISSLRANSRSSQRIKLTAPKRPGTYYYGACIEPVKNEASTQNNCSKAVELKVAAQRPKSVPVPKTKVAPATAKDKPTPPPNKPGGPAMPVPKPR